MIADLRARLAVIGAAMALFLVGAVVTRSIALAQAPEIIVAAEGFDPREPLVGHYVAFQLSPARVTVSPEATWLQPGREVWVELAPTAVRGDYRPLALHPSQPPATPERLVLRAEVAYVTPTGAFAQDCLPETLAPGESCPEPPPLPLSVQLDYGVDRIYLPQAKAEEVQALAFRPDRPAGPPFLVILAHFEDGGVAVKGILVGDERIEVQTVPVM